MTERWYRAVPELKVSVEKSLVLTTRWNRAELELTPEMRPWVDHHAPMLTNGWFPITGSMAAFIEPIAHLPVWLVRTTPPPPQESSEPNEVLRFARGADATEQYDAFALLTGARWKSWLHEDFTSASAELRAASKAAGDKGLPLLIRQEIEVTRTCDRAIRPACTAFPFAARALDRFLAQELGHDRMLEQSLRDLGRSANELNVTADVVTLLNRLSSVATRNYAGLCLLIDLFESVEPVWDAFEHVPEGARRHAAINETERHADVAFTLLEALPTKLLTREEASAALAARTAAEADMARANRALAKLLNAG